MRSYRKERQSGFVKLMAERPV